MKCHLCEGNTTAFVDEKHAMHYYHCQVCDVIFKDPASYQSIEAQKSRYDLHENDEESEGYRAYFQRFLDFVLPLLQEEVSCALDFGCGRSQLLASMLQAQHIDCDAYDPIYHPEGYDREKTYDLIVSTEVFEHLHDPKAVLHRLLGSLKKGGYIAIQTAFHYSDKEAFLQWYYPKDPTHIVFFSPKTFQHLCGTFGCEYVADNGKNMVLLKKV